MNLLQQAHHTLGVDKLIQLVVVPYLSRIGELWCERTWGEYQEAIASQTVRDFLANLRREMYVPESAPLIVGSCLPGEYHEIPMHILLVQCALKGYRTMMLGQSPAPKAMDNQKKDIVNKLMEEMSEADGYVDPRELELIRKILCIK